MLRNIRGYAANATRYGAGSVSLKQRDKTETGARSCRKENHGQRGLHARIRRPVRAEQEGADFAANYRANLRNSILPFDDAIGELLEPAGKRWRAHLHRDRLGFTRGKILIDRLVPEFRHQAEAVAFLNGG
jgi:hypothetical protein